MSVEEIHVGNIGTVFEVTLYSNASDALDVSTALGATDKQIIFSRPDGSIVTNNASFVGDGSDGKIDYTTVLAAELDQTGRWNIQAKVILTGPARTFRTNVGSFFVWGNL